MKLFQAILLKRTFSMEGHIGLLEKLWKEESSLGLSMLDAPTWLGCTIANKSLTSVPSVQNLLSPFLTKSKNFSFSSLKTTKPLIPLLQKGNA
jgi:hypothetical protein